MIHEQFMEELDQCADGADPSPQEASVMDFLEQLDESVELLRESPQCCPIVGIKNGLAIRQLIVDGQFFVYYVYTPPCEMAPDGEISIRSIKHPESQDPVLETRETLAGDAIGRH